MRPLLALLLMSGMATAEGEPAGHFDYYILSLSWSPTWCALEGDARRAPQCDAGRNFGWVLHGLWPQNETGWPSYCRTSASDPPRSQTNGMADIMGSSGPAWYQWKKHGRCSGLTSGDYFDVARQAYENVNRPAVFRNLKDAVNLRASVVEQAFLRENLDWRADMVTVTCKSHRIQEVRLCLTKQLEPRICGADVRRDCSLSNALFDPIE